MKLKTQHETTHYSTLVPVTRRSSTNWKIIAENNEGGEKTGVILTSDLQWGVGGVAFRKASLILKGVFRQGKESLYNHCHCAGTDEISPVILAAFKEELGNVVLP